MRKNIKKFVSITVECLPLREPIYEFGSLQVPEQEGFSDLRTFFEGRKYIGADMRTGPGVDKILDLHNIDLASESAGTVLCLDTLEHVEYPRRALQEIHRILIPSGVAVISSVLDFPIHDYPFDYWRFTPAAFSSLLKPFKHSFVGFAGNKNYPHTIVGVGFKGEQPELREFIDKYEHWRKVQNYDLEHVMIHITPPILQPLLHQVYSIITGLKKALIRPHTHK